MPETRLRRCAGRRHGGHSGRRPARGGKKWLPANNPAARGAWPDFYRLLLTGASAGLLLRRPARLQD